MEKTITNRVMEAKLEKQEKDIIKKLISVDYLTVLLSLSANLITKKIFFCY